MMNEEYTEHFEQARKFVEATDQACGGRADGVVAPGTGDGPALTFEVLRGLLEDYDTLALAKREAEWMQLGDDL